MNQFSDWEVGKDYKCRKILGQGGYGKVCAAIHKPTGTKVAIKQLTGIFEDETDCKRILREVDLLAKLNNPYVVGLFDIIEPVNHATFDMVYLVLVLSEKHLQSFKEAPRENLGARYAGASPEAIDLFNKMLQFNPFFRLSVDQCIEHPFFAKIRKVENELKASAPIVIDFEN